LRLLNNLIY